MYTGMLHTHTLVVGLFLLLYLVKTALLLAGKNDLLDKFTKKTRIVEMVVSTLFLLTGIYLATQAPSISAGNWFWVKLIAVFAAIPLAIIGFKRKKKALALLSFVLLVYAYGISETKSVTMNKADYFSKLAADDAPSYLASEYDTNADNYDILVHGKAVFINYCVRCHGEDGKLGSAGAKDLTLSMLDKGAMIERITLGKGGMPAFGKVLSPEEIMASVAYTKAALSDAADAHAQ
jgi:mono/diheme cytochrome c family protein